MVTPLDYVAIALVVLAVLVYVWPSIKAKLAVTAPTTLPAVNVNVPTPPVTKANFDAHAQLDALQKLYAVADADTKKIIIDLKNRMLTLE